MMLAYHSDRKIKEKYLRRVLAHAKADRLVQGVAWENGRGCAIGCTLEAYDHGRYETELGIPRIIARLEDGLFERLPKADAMKWPAQVLSAIKPGADLSGVWPKFAHWLMVDPEHGVIRWAKREDSKAAIKLVAALYESGVMPTKEDARKARAAAAAAAAYDDAAAAAAYAAYAAYAAADAAAAAYAYAAWRPVKTRETKAQAAKLLELLREAPVKRAAE
jgi:hypothetical protein